jgi:hypothetical protein
MGRELKTVRVGLNIGILVSSIDYKSGKGLVTCEDGSTYCSDVVVDVMESIVWCMRKEKREISDLRKSGKSAEAEFVGSLASSLSLLANGFAVLTSKYRVLWCLSTSKWS